MKPGFIHSEVDIIFPFFDLKFDEGSVFIMSNGIPVCILITSDQSHVISVNDAWFLQR